MKRRFALLAAMAMVAYGLAAQTPAPAKAPVPATAMPPGAASTPAKAPALAPAKADPWASVRFLLGLWEAKTTGGMAQAQVAGAYSFRLELRDHLLARHSRSGVCASADDADCQHSDLLYIYPAGAALTMQAIYFDNEGHVIHYGVSVPKPGTAVFLSDATQPGPQFRLTYEFLDGVMTGKFEIKLPGQTEFTSYLEWSGKRQ